MKRKSPVRTAAPSRRTALVALAALPLAACTIVPGANGPPPRLFVLSPKSTFPPDLPRTEWQLGVDVPVASAALNTARIAVRQQPLSIEYYEQANWIDTAPHMVQMLIIESFENSGKVPAVAQSSAALREDFSILSELRQFRAEYHGPDSPPTVHVQLNAKLVQMPQRIIVGSTRIERRIAAPGMRLEDVVLGFDDALGKVLRELVIWTLKTLPPGPSGSANG